MEISCRSKIDAWGHDRFPSADFFEALLKFAMFELKIFPFRHDSDFQNHLQHY